MLDNGSEIEIDCNDDEGVHMGKQYDNMVGKAVSDRIQEHVEAIWELFDNCYGEDVDGFQITFTSDHGEKEHTIINVLRRKDAAEESN